MDKKFIATTWDKNFRAMPCSLKVAWFYMWLKCDASGVYEIDEDYFKIDTGIKFDLDSILDAFGEAVQQIAPGKLLIVGFISVNYGKVKAEYNPHKPVFRALEKNGLKLAPSLDQACPKLEKIFFKLVDVDEDEDKDVDEDEDKKPAKQKKGIVFPYQSAAFLEMWEQWKEYRKDEHGFKYKSKQSQQAALNGLANISKDESHAIAIMKQSMEKGWKGFFELKNKPNESSDYGKQRKAAINEILKQAAAGTLKPS